MTNNRQLKRFVLEIEKAQDEVAATRTERLPHTSTWLFLEFGLLTPVNFEVPPRRVGNFPRHRSYSRAEHVDPPSSVRPIHGD